MSLERVEYGDVISSIRAMTCVSSSVSQDAIHWPTSGNARGERRVFACRAVYLSAHEIGIAGPVCGKVGERVIANIDHLGKLKGRFAGC